MSGKTAPNVLPGQPRDGDGPVFAEPWQAQAFALTLKLYEAGHFTWREWAETLGAEIDAARASGDPDLGDTYYRHWLAALERLVAEKQWCPAGELDRRTGEFAARPVGHDH
jgi:nitrile hydratase accessory protein